MSMVNFTNAKIDVVESQGTVVPVYWNNASINATTLTDISGNTINSNGICNLIVDEAKKYEYIYSGSFVTSGTEFYIDANPGSVPKNARWKISNISFQSGDTYSFQIPITLTCN